MSKISAVELLKLYKHLGYKEASSLEEQGIYKLDANAISLQKAKAKVNATKVNTVSKITKSVTSNVNTNIAKPQNKALNQTANKTLAEEKLKIYQKLKNITELEELKKEILAFEGCALKKTAISTVFGYGNENSDILFLGEGPGAEEDKEGKPFVGKSGKLLTLALQSIGLLREDIFITNTVFWRPPGNRAPTSQEMQACEPFVEKIIELVNPKVVVALGSTPYKFLSKELNPRITKDRGKLKKALFNSGKEFNYIPTFHPAYLLRSPLQKRAVWEDLLKIKKSFLSIWLSCKILYNLQLHLN